MSRFVGLDKTIGIRKMRYLDTPDRDWDRCMVILMKSAGNCCRCMVSLGGFPARSAGFFLGFLPLDFGGFWAFCRFHLWSIRRVPKVHVAYSTKFAARHQKGALAVASQLALD